MSDTPISEPYVDQRRIENYANEHRISWFEAKKALIKLDDQLTRKQRIDVLRQRAPRMQTVAGVHALLMEILELLE